MGYDIFARNQNEEAVAYKRFSMGNSTSYQFYEFFDALEFHGGVSGIGAGATYSIKKLKMH